ATPADAGLERRLALSRELVTLSLGPDFSKQLERYLAEQFEKAAPETSDEAVWLRANVPGMVTRAVVAMVGDMAPVYARIFTEEELAGQVAYFRSPAGRAASAKAMDLGIAMQEVQSETMSNLVGEMQAKYCAQFDCGGGGQGRANAKPGRH
ncbi:hypothetical protein LTR94_031523, partial [Friedmanniomyces endolithicus]